MSIKWIFFDFDGVITLDKSGSVTTCNYLSQYIKNKTFDEILEVYRIWHQDMLVGKVSHKEIWKDFCLKLEIDLNYEILEKAFLETPINQEIINLAKSLKQNYKIGIITDNSFERLKLISKNQRFSDVFDLVIVSGAIGSKKNNEEIFKATLEKSTARAKECIFIDNSEKNLIVPNAIGFKTIFYDDQKRDIKGLEKTLKKILE